MPKLSTKLKEESLRQSNIQEAVPRRISSFGDTGRVREGKVEADLGDPLNAA